MTIEVEQLREMLVASQKELVERKRRCPQYADRPGRRDRRNRQHDRRDRCGETHHQIEGNRDRHMKQDEIKSLEDCQAFIREAIGTRCQRVEASGRARLGHLAKMDPIRADDLRNVANDIESAQAQREALNTFAAMFTDIPAQVLEPATWMKSVGLLQASAGTSKAEQFAVVLVTNWMMTTVNQALSAMFDNVGNGIEVVSSMADIRSNGGAG